MNEDVEPNLRIPIEIYEQNTWEEIRATKQEFIEFIDTALSEIRKDLEKIPYGNFSTQLSLIIEELEYYKAIVETLDVTKEHARKLAEIVVPGIASIQTYFQLCKEKDLSINWNKK